MNSLAKAGLLCCLLCGSLAHAAGINIGTTRVIFHGDAKDASISISNSDNVPYLIQSWAQSISETGASGDAPFMVTPPLFRLNGGQKNVLRIIRTGGNLPEDRESLYWLDIKSIPSSNPDNKHNTLMLAVKAEFKLIYRPKALTPKTRRGCRSVNVVASGSHAHREEPHALLYELRHPFRWQSKSESPALCGAFRQRAVHAVCRRQRPDCLVYHQRFWRYWPRT
ncbi:fimbrial assembly chaperone [Salmonella enterica subsp. enterica]|uniref:Fimbrial assembly chaperone n=1 Tax=Salmonella enterica I TaxID=59201 RepID=A0A379VWS6_SALET|nr:fimbrial assembly chaperone [Salmonella enterica subsp. enterica]